MVMVTSDESPGNSIFRLARENRDLKAEVARLAEERDALKRVEAENFFDLGEQMAEAWGRGWMGVSQEEFWAFLDSRHVHRPTRTLREESAALKAENERLREGLREAVLSLRHAWSVADAVAKNPETTGADERRTAENALRDYNIAMRALYPGPEAEGAGS